MLENSIWDELYDQLPGDLSYNGSAVSITYYRAKQDTGEFSYPGVLIDFLTPTIDELNTPINKVTDRALVTADDDASYDDIQYTYRIIIRESITFDLYDKDIDRIAKFQNDLYIWLWKNLSLTDIVVFRLNPATPLDFTEEEYIYRRQIEVVCKYSMDYQDVVKQILDVETTTDTEQG